MCLNISVKLETEGGQGDVSRVVSCLKVRGVRFILWLRYERHRLVLQVVPVQALEQGVMHELCWTQKVEIKHGSSED